jgi:NAD(P)-dependent dehydrogenase (short-subunit alcohol dehydrogenase family)
LQGEVALITGAGRGLGDTHAKTLAAAASKVMVMVNDLGGSARGAGSDPEAARSVADQIAASSGTAIATAHTNLRGV